MTRVPPSPVPLPLLRPVAGAGANAMARVAPSGTQPAVDRDSLIARLCRRFSEATGWRLEYALVGRSPSAGREPPPSGVCWQAAIDDGETPAGWLRLAAPRVETACSLRQATDLAGALGEMLQTLADGRRRLASRTDEVSTLVDLGMAIPVRDSLAWSLAQLMRGSVQLTASRSAAFFLLDASLRQLRLRAVSQMDAAGISDTTRDILESPHDLEALARGVTHVTSAAAGDRPFPPEARSAFVVAVESETMPLGTLWVFDRRSRTFGERDRHVLQSIAAQIAAVLERVALLRGSEKHDRITRELEQATLSQPSVLPTDLPPDPRFELAAHVASCHELGGDLCEIIPLPQGRVGVAVGDASGHTIASAMIMSAVRGALRAHPGDERSLTRTMQRLNEALYSITHSHQFMSLCYGIFDPCVKGFTYSNAGHPNPLLLRSGEIVPLSSHGLLLGVLRDTDHGQSTLDLQSGDILVLFSDGLSEARGGQQQMFRSEGIAGALLRSQRGSARDILQSIWLSVEHHLAGGSADDDRTLVVLLVK